MRNDHRAFLKKKKKNFSYILISSWHRCRRLEQHNLVGEEGEQNIIRVWFVIHW